MELIIRPYEPRDRAAVRRICCETADSGKPVERFFHDREVFGDLLTRYYTDVEPESSWVVEEDGRVVGYLTGCLDTRRFLRVMIWRIVPAAVVRACGRGTLFQGMTRRLLAANWRMALGGTASDGELLNNFPAHLHVNLQNGFRGQQAGRRLVEAFCAQARTMSVAGIHLQVSADNEAGCRFFGRLGFRELSRQPRFRMPDDPDRVVESVTYGKRLS